MVTKPMSHYGGSRPIAPAGSLSPHFSPHSSHVIHRCMILVLLALVSTVITDSTTCSFQNGMAPTRTSGTSPKLVVTHMTFSGKSTGFHHPGHAGTARTLTRHDGTIGSRLGLSSTIEVKLEYVMKLSSGAKPINIIHRAPPPADHHYPQGSHYQLTGGTGLRCNSCKRPPFISPLHQIHWSQAAQHPMDMRSFVSPSTRRRSIGRPQAIEQSTYPCGVTHNQHFHACPHAPSKTSNAATHLLSTQHQPQVPCSGYRP